MIRSELVFRFPGWVEHVCGICGFVGAGSESLIRAMAETIKHRGPDADGYYIDSARRLFLGHRRLAIIDLDHGSQPLGNEDGTVQVVFNGEIYNHLELRRELESRGHTFTTRADTEVIVHAYEEYGRCCPEKLDGMFAFVLWDARKKILFGARDRFGKKPLFYTSGPASRGDDRVDFAFASEIKSLRDHPTIADSLSVNREALRSYLLNDYVVGERTIFSGVQSLRPGHWFTYGPLDDVNALVVTQAYWKLDVSNNNDSLDEAEAADELIRLLSEAVERRLMSDVPLGALLSGGIDSSAVVAMMARHLDARAIQTFSIAFDEASFDESRYANQVASAFGTQHHVRRFRSADLPKRLPAVLDNMDQPFADPSILPVSLLCEYARQHVTVALGGDGGDELFAGYDPFRALSWARRFRLLPRIVDRLLVDPVSRMVPASSRNMSLQFKVHRFLRGARHPDFEQLPVWMGPFESRQLHKIAPDLATEIEGNPYEEFADAWRSNQARGLDDVQNAVDYFSRFYLPDDILVKVDRASMMHSLEVRAPFLDTRLAQFVNGLPSSFKLCCGRTKHLLKRALTRGNASERILSRETVYRSKKGFGIPVAKWIRDDLHDQFRDALFGPWPDALDVFERSAVQQLYERHIAGAENNYKELWALFVLVEWGKRHLA